MTHRLVMTENIVAATVSALRQAAEQAMDSGATRLQLDLARVQDLDSVGLSVLIGISMSLQRAGGALELYNVRDEVFDIIHSMRLDKHFQVHRFPTERDATSS
ncbi:STAS domain-containing protein [Megalodesulfovibrio gigas]|uniref:STAS domain-containing protein n=1 Tax=Megalodesulfovibrio gigas TaxID=879 RepID=UPI00130D6115|nr:STAS domain-containing protein [Megalodesulfovibrio gigas]